jgi:hypothetical protein
MERNKAKQKQSILKGALKGKSMVNPLNNKLEVERAKYKASGGIATDNLQFKQ